MGWALVIVVMATIQARPVRAVRPLVLCCDPIHTVAVQAVRAMSVSPHRFSPGLTRHVLIGFLRENTQCVGDIADVQRRWRMAAPGTLFFWDSKYCQEGTDPQASRRLHEYLSSLGRLVYSAEDNQEVVQVFFRRDTRRVAAATTAAASSGRASRNSATGDREGADTATTRSGQHSQVLQ